MGIHAQVKRDSQRRRDLIALTFGNNIRLLQCAVCNCLRCPIVVILSMTTRKWIGLPLKSMIIINLLYLVLFEERAHDLWGIMDVNELSQLRKTNLYRIVQQPSCD